MDLLPPKALVVVSHPSWTRSIANKGCVAAIQERWPCEIHLLQNDAPNWDIEHEQRLLSQTDLWIFQFPLFWYGVPGRMKSWLDDVFSWGWAFDANGGLLRGKHMVCSVTVGSDLASYAPGKRNKHGLETYLSSLEQFANYTGIEWHGIIPTQARDWKDEPASEGTKYRFQKELEVVFNQLPPHSVEPSTDKIVNSQ